MRSCLRGRGRTPSDAGETLTDCIITDALCRLAAMVADDPLAVSAQESKGAMRSIRSNSGAGCAAAAVLTVRPLSMLPLAFEGSPEALTLLATCSVGTACTTETAALDADGPTLAAFVGRPPRDTFLGRPPARCGAGAETSESGTEATETGAGEWALLAETLREAALAREVGVAVDVEAATARAA